MNWPWLTNGKLKAQVQEQAKQVQELRLTVVDILTATKTIGEDESGNQYTDKRLAIQAIYRKYRDEDEWGCQLMQRIINHRMSMVLPYGVKVMPAEGFDAETAADEMAFVEAFMERNDFDSMEDKLCRQGEMEGEVLVLMSWDDNPYEVGDVTYDGMPIISRRLWSVKQWDTILNKDDPDKIEKVVMDGGKVELKPGEPWVLAAFNATSYAPDFQATTNTDAVMKLRGMPVAAFCLTNAENMDKGMVNWRKVNRYFGNLTPFIQSDSPSETVQIQATIEKSGWRVGKLVVGRGYKLVGPDTDVSQLLYTEVRANAQMLSVTTGIPIHQLGFPDLIGGGRATSESMTEIDTISLNDMGTWWNFYHQLFAMAITERNKKLPNKQLNPNAVEPKLLPSGTQAWGRIKDVFLPAGVNGLISKKLFLKQLPDVDVEEEMKQMAAEGGGGINAWPEGLAPPSDGAYSKAAEPGATTPA